MRKGFTLIEAMIVFAMIGILAAIAIPNFIKFQEREQAKQAEVKKKRVRKEEPPVEVVQVPVVVPASTEVTILSCESKVVGLKTCNVCVLSNGHATMDCE